MEYQSEFLFGEGTAAAMHLPDPNSGLFAEILAAWRLPVGQRVRVTLQDHSFDNLRGRLELVRLPDLPFDSRQPLSLRIGTIEFSTRQIVAWSLA
jgi:hypothetical protein